MKYLKKCLTNSEFIETNLNEVPTFVKEKVDMIYIGPTTEKFQEKVIDKLKLYKDKIQELIDNNVIFLATGNSMEIFGKYIENEDGSKIDALGLFDIYAKRNMLNRHNSIFVGQYEDAELVGFKSQFTFAYGNNDNMFFSKVEKGIGLNPESTLEGIQKNNFIGTYIIGPILILNPQFTYKLLKKIGVKEPKLALEEDVRKAYEQRIKELKCTQ